MTTTTETLQARCDEAGDRLASAADEFLRAYSRYVHLRARIDPDGKAYGSLGPRLPRTPAGIGLVTMSGVAEMAGVTHAVVSRAVRDGTLPRATIPAWPAPARYYTAEHAARLAADIKAGRHRPEVTNDE